MSELLYGRHAVLETLRAKRRHIYRLWLEGESKPKRGDVIDEIRAAAEAASIPIRAIDGGLFDRLKQENTNAQGVALEVDDYPYVDVAACLARAQERGEPPFLLLLDHLQDPQNLGTLLRTAETLGTHGVVIPDRRAARVTPAVSNASSGAVEHLLIAQETNLNRTIDWLKRQNVWVAGLAGEADVPLLDAKQLDGAIAVVVGNEGSGLSRLTREKCDFLLRLPMFGQVESLNASVAGSIVLYEARRVRGEKSK